MLTLDGTLRSGSFTVYRDVEYRDGQRSLTNLFYVLADTPRLSTDDSGGPAFRFLRYRGLDGSTQRGGGRLTLTVEIGPTSDERAQLAQDLAHTLSIADPSTVKIETLPASAGTVALSFGGDSDGGDLVQQAQGNGAAELVGDERATFAVDLTVDGVALLDTALAHALAVLHVHYDLTFEYRLDAISLRVWCDGHQAHDQAAARGALGPVDPAQLVAGMVANHAAGVELTCATAIPDDQRDALQALGQQLLTASVNAALFDPSSDGKSSTLRPYDPGIEATFNHTYSESFPAERHAVLDATLTLQPTADELAARELVVDLVAAPALALSLLCAIDFAAGMVGSVHLFIDYAATASDGSTVTSAADCLFKAGAIAQSIRLNAVAGARSYRYRSTVYYSNGATLDVPEATTDQTVLVIDGSGLGVIDLQVTLGDVPLSVVRSAVVDLEYPPKGLTSQLILDGANATQRWQAIAGDAVLAPLRYRVAWLLSDGRRLTGDWLTTAAPRVLLDAPPGLDASSTVQAIAAGDFGAIAQLVLDLRTGPSPTDTTAQLTFTRAGESQTWAMHPADPHAPLHYQARSTIVYQDGRVFPFAWIDEDAPFLVVRDQLAFTVAVVPRLLDFGGTLQLAIVELEAAETGVLPQGQSLVLRDRATESAWSFRLAAPDHHHYRYRLTLVPKSGARSVGTWQDADQEVLVLSPPTAQ